MTDACSSRAPFHPLAAFLSALVPGLGQAIKGQFRSAAAIVLTGILLVGATWWIGRTAGIGTAVFVFMLVMLPWWALQSYDALLPPLPESAGPGMRQTLKIAWRQAHDIRYLGGLFLLTAFTDLYIIIANPEYALTVFCAKPGGFWGFMAKAQSPTLHVLIGYGFIRRRLWSFWLYLAYAGFGLLNATANYACFGYGRVRTVFLITLIAFTAYVVWRRECFRPVSEARPGL